MKRFFPSSVMLVPFVVKDYFDEDQEDNSSLDVETNTETEAEKEE